MKSAGSCCLIILLTVAGAEGRDWAKQFRDWLVSKSLPVSELPAPLRAEPGKVSLVTNFKIGADGQIEVYLVNLTKTPLELEDNFKVMLERQTLTGWERAEYHRDTMNCLGTLMGELAPGRMIKVPGYQPREGERSTVRFRLYQFSMIEGEGIVTGFGPGLASPREVALASRDGRSVWTCPLERLIQMASGELRIEDHPYLMPPGELRTP